MPSSIKTSLCWHYLTRMHSSRMRTAGSSSHGGGGWTRSPSISPLGVGLDLIPLNSPLGVGLDLIPLNFPLGVGLDLIPLNFPLGCGPGPDPPQLPPWVWAWRPHLGPDPPARYAGIPPPPPPPVDRHTPVKTTFANYVCGR